MTPTAGTGPITGKGKSLLGPEEIQVAFAWITYGQNAHVRIDYAQGTPNPSVWEADVIATLLQKAWLFNFNTNLDVQQRFAGVTIVVPKQQTEETP